MPLNRIDLDFAAAAGCDNPDCDHKKHDGIIFMKSKCHPRADVQASYTKGTGLVRIVCAECQRPLADIKVAEQ